MIFLESSSEMVNLGEYTLIEYECIGRNSKIQYVRRLCFSKL